MSIFDNRYLAIAAIAAIAALAACASADHADHAMHEHAMQSADTRESVRFPPMLYEHELANMRDHLATLQQIQAALAKGDYDGASHLAEQRLGLTSLPMHGAHEVAPYMPQPMQDIGTSMHRAASRFAVEATNASATGDVKPALAALSTLTAQCVACHAAYRLER